MSNYTQDNFSLNQGKIKNLGNECNVWKASTCIHKYWRRVVEQNKLEDLFSPSFATSFIYSMATLQIIEQTNRYSQSRHIYVHYAFNSLICVLKYTPHKEHWSIKGGNNRVFVLKYIYQSYVPCTKQFYPVIYDARYNAIVSDNWN